MNSQVVSDIVKGNILKALQVKDNSTEVEYPDKRKAWIENSKIKDLEEWYAGLNPTEENLLATAKTMMGIPYFWGGTSIKGLDCSGFVKNSLLFEWYIPSARRLAAGACG